MTDEAPRSAVDGTYDQVAMERLAGQLASVVEAPLVVYLEGDLGAGKTTLVRAFLRGLGYPGRVKSPTYGLLERYDAGDLSVLHLDLYRIADPGELEYLGIGDLFDDETLLMVEWPERGSGHLPKADITLRFEHARTRRRLAWQSHSARGRSIYTALAGLIS